MKIFVKLFYKYFKINKIFISFITLFSKIQEELPHFIAFLSFFLLFSKMLLILIILCEILQGYIFYTFYIFFLIFLPFMSFEIILFISYYFSKEIQSFIETFYIITLNRETNKIIYQKKDLKTNIKDEENVDKIFGEITNILNEWEFHADFVYEVEKLILIQKLLKKYFIITFLFIFIYFCLNV